MFNIGKTEALIEKLLPSLEELEHLFDELWPICRSITGKGFEQSLDLLKQINPEIQSRYVKSGTKVLDWEVPKEWNIRNAYIDHEDGTRIVDFKENNLHVVSYSTPIDSWLTLDELQNHLYSLENMPEAIPYVTSYYKSHWGFCITHKRRQSLKQGRYHVVIESSLENGRLTYGHHYLKSSRDTEEEVLLSTYLCHPSMANNELSGPIVTTYVLRALSQLPTRRFNYRTVIVPETIGSIAFLSTEGEKLKKNCKAGLVINCCGSSHPYTYKRSRDGKNDIDAISEHVLKSENAPHEIVDFFPFGSDERQYCSPGFNLPVGSLMRAMYGKYDEYHTSLDNRSFISFRAMRETVKLYLKVLLSFEGNKRFRSNVMYGEPQLSPRGLYPTLGSAQLSSHVLTWMMWFLNFADGKHDLCTIANKAGCSVIDLSEIADVLVEKNLISEYSE
jgi:aminopeptidase-like protein